MQTIKSKRDGLLGDGKMFALSMVHSSVQFLQSNSEIRLQKKKSPQLNQQTGVKKRSCSLSIKDQHRFAYFLCCCIWDQRIR